MRFLRLVAVWIGLLGLPALGRAEPIDVCGTVQIGGLNCLVIRTDSDVFYLPNPRPTNVASGDRVRLTGQNETCSNFCATLNCVSGATVAPCPQYTCRADFDRSGALGVQDIFAFLTAYFGNVLGDSPPGGDFDRNGVLSVGDIFSFLAAYFAGCP